MTSTDYEAWIAEWVGDCDCLCQEYTYLMQKHFPELLRVYGDLYCADEDAPGEPHWWCVAPDGEVVDPTAQQFEEGSVFPKPWEYIPLYESTLMESPPELRRLEKFCALVTEERNQVLAKAS